MIKKILMITFFSLSFDNICLSEQAIAYVPSNTVITWDFHDVFAYKPLFKMGSALAGLIWHAPNSWDLISLVFSPTFIKELYNKRKEIDSGERLLEAMIDEYPATLGLHREAIFDIINLHEIDEQMSLLLEKLKELGYKNVLASNIGPVSLSMMKHKWPSFFALFDGFYGDGLKDAQGNLYTQLLKPSPDYFKGLQRYLIDNGLAKPHILFIDDRRANLDGASQANVGIEPIHFINTRQLNNEFAKRGILSTAL